MKKKEKPLYEVRIIKTKDGFKAMKKPRRKKSKYQKLDDDNFFEAEMIRQRRTKILKGARALPWS